MPYQDCEVRLENNCLIAENACMLREWDLSQGLPRALSLKNKSSGHQWINKAVAEKASIGPCFNNFLFEGAKEPPQIHLTHLVDDDLGVGEKALCATVEMLWADCGLRWTLRLYPQKNFMRFEYETKGQRPFPTKHEEVIGNLEDFIYRANKTAGETDALDAIAIADTHVKWKAVNIWAISDYNGNMVTGEKGLKHNNERRYLPGNVFFAHQLLGEEGLILIKEAPTPKEQLRYPGGDFCLKQGVVLVTGSGAEPSQDYVKCYGCAVGVYQGGELEALQTLRDYHECRHTFREEFDSFLTCNTWGDRFMGNKLCDAFLKDEIKAAKEIGLTHVQIDMGWQKPCPNQDDNKWIWEFDEKKFKNGLAEVKAEADKQGIQLGIWFRPNSLRDSADWEKDADILIDLHKRYGFTHFKLDGFRFNSLKGYQNYRYFIEKVYRETKGQMAFNTDITADRRTGYFGQAQYGTFFVENRYTDWKNYFPHRTLNTLWKLSAYVPTYRLQMEYLNVERNPVYTEGEDDPLAPYKAGLAYSLACVLMANPLGWYETTGLSQEARAVFGSMLKAYRPHQTAILKGLVLPLGQEPDGTNWTGFQSMGENSGYVLALKGLCTKNEFAFPVWEEGTKFEKILSKDCELIDTANKTLTFSSPKPFSYALYRYTK